MKNTMLNNDTLTIIDTPFSKNKSTKKYSDANQLLIDALQKALKLNIGCNFELDTLYGKEIAVCLQDNTYTNAQQVKEQATKKVVNFFDCASICMSDRCFVCSKNSNGALIITVLPIAKMKKEFFVKDENSAINDFIECKNIFTNQTVKISTKLHKGKRLISENEQKILLQVFNTMLGSGWNKPIVQVAKKNNKEVA